MDMAPNGALEAGSITTLFANNNPGVLDCAAHFERMLYDNSQLARVYLHAWLLTSSQSQAVTGNEFVRTITEEILDYVAREMLDPEGGFYSTQEMRWPSPPCSSWPASPTTCVM